MNVKRLLITLALVGAALFGIAWLRSGGSVVESGSPEDQSWFLYAADSKGAVIASSSGVQGVGRDGSAVWKHADDFVNYVCDRRCPATIMSGSVDGTNSALVADPTPVAEGGAKSPTFTGKGKRQVLAADGDARVQFAGRPDSFVLELVLGDHVTKRIPVAGFGASWFPNSDNSAGVFVGQGNSPNESISIPIRLTKSGGWELAAEPRESELATGCVSAGGGWALSDASHIVNLRTDQVVALQVPEEAQVSNCAFSNNHFITVLYSLNQGASGSTNTASLVVYDMKGKVVHQQSFSGDNVVVDADARHDRIAVLVDTQVQVLDPAGSVIKKIDGVAGARFDELGELVTISDTGRVAWTSF